ncbi:MAG: hypothetical protein HQK83_13995 [Fibrobacteria bacterium]|nr:hypothetical protein [Fibrobacteria bacterium]
MKMFTPYHFPRHLQDIATKLSGFPEEVVQNHLEGLDNDYFHFFSLPAIKKHIEFAQKILPNENQNCFVKLTLNVSGKFKIDLIGRDAPGFFAVLTGVLTSYYFDIHTGRIFTCNPKNTPAYFIDSLTGVYQPPEKPQSAETLVSDIESQLNELLSLLLSHKTRQAQKIMHQVFGSFLAGTKKQSVSGSLAPLDINAHSLDQYTVLHVTGTSVPGFLFSLSNALSLNNIIIHKILIETKDKLADDTLFITDKHNRPITNQLVLSKLQTVVALIKQFTLMLPSASDYDLAMDQFEKFLTRLTSKNFDLSELLSLNNSNVFSTLASAFGSGKYIWEDFLKNQSESMLPILRTLEQLKKPKSKDILFAELSDELGESDLHPDMFETENKLNILNQYKDKELFRIDMLHLVYPNKTFFQLGSELSDLADVIINTAIHILRSDLVSKYGSPMFEGEKCRFAVMALGKFGGQELGYASDLELILIYEGAGDTNNDKNKISNTEFFNLLVRELKRSIKARSEGIFEIDLRLRPNGNSGELSASLPYWCKYYSIGGAAHDYERQALIKLRPVYGDNQFTNSVLSKRDDILYGEQKVGISKTLTLRQKQLKELVTDNRINAKYSTGGLCEIEYGIQFLQLQYGHDYPLLRVPSTINAMEQLLHNNLLSASEYERLYNSYAFLRRLINSLRLIRGNAHKLLIPHSENDEFRQLSHRMGYVLKVDSYNTEKLKEDIDSVFKTVHTFFKSRFIEFSKPSFSKPGLPDLLSQADLPKEDIERILSAMQIKNKTSVYNVLKQLMSSINNKGALIANLVMAQRFIKQSPSPDTVIINLHKYLVQAEVNEEILRQMLSHPLYLEILINILGHGDFISGILIRHPFLIHYVTTHSSLSNSKTVDSYLSEISPLTETGDFDVIMDNLRMYNQRELLRIGVRDIAYQEPLTSIINEISNLCDAIVTGAYNTVFRLFSRNKSDIPLSNRQCIIALGKQGGRELNYSSDIDLIFVTQNDLDDTEFTSINNLNREFMHCLTKQSSLGKLYRVDTNLRPYGAQGGLSGSYKYYINYYKSKAQGWELQSWLKARVIAGNRQLGNRLIQSVRNLFLADSNREFIQQSMNAVRMKALKEFSRYDVNRDVKHGPGGLRTVEFYVQYLQGKFGNKHPSIISGHTLNSLESLRVSGIIKQDKYDALSEAYIFMRRIEHSLQLQGMQQRHVLPDNLDELAKRMGFEDRLNEPASIQFQKLYNQHSKYLISVSEELFPGSSKQIL